MKVLALGGSGDMGRMAVTVLLPSSKITSITIADKNYEFTKTFVELVGSDKLSAVEIDVTNQKELNDLILRHDIVLNTVGPYYKFGKFILDAVINAKKPYFDICDDWKPTLELLEMDEKAKKAGVTAIVGIGASPGVLNLMAVMASSSLDKVDEVVTAWGMGPVKSGKKPKYFIKKKKIFKKLGKPVEETATANAAIVHLLYESIGKIPTFKDGERVEIEALTEVDPIQFPGYADAYAVHIGHPEPITLPRTINANSISNVMFIGKNATAIVREYSNKITKNEISITDAAIKLNEEFERAQGDSSLLKEYFNMPPELCVIATGLKNNKRIKIAIGLKYSPYGEMAGITGIPLAVATLMYIDGNIQEKGVLTPEEAINPDEFFNRYAVYCKESLTKNDVLIIKEENL
ncbi:MAG: saccharopine dehydrogenase NADP-binding domain-containing protein [Candidatus Helarchaeota archaeon]|nr:saccharopine dehydrogenase NADP-binding domain-containing protein [Candidatus Helarchaeota archaeon]